MRGKRRRALEVPPKIRLFIDSVTSRALDNIEEPLRGFVWEFDKGSFHHWDDLFNHFDIFFEKFIKPRKDLQVEGSSEEIDPPFPREAVLQVLRVTRVILENCRKKHIYNSYEQHLSLLLASTDIDVVEASLETLSAFLRKAVGRCCIRDASLSSKLFAFSQGWGSKEGGLGLVDCSLKDGCDPLASFIGSTLHFEFYANSDTSNSPDSAGNHGLQVIDISNINLIKENDLELFHKLVKEYNVPHRLRFSLLTRLRFARGFGCIASRHQYICIRLLAFVVLVQACNETDDLATFFNNEPEFVNELVSLLCFEDVPEKIRTLAILSLAALCQNRSHQPMVLSSVTSGSNRGILPSLLHKAVDALVSGSAKCSIIFTDALLSLVHDLVTSSPGSLPLREAGFISTILPLLKDTKPQHLPLVTTAVHILEGFLDYSNHPATLFRDLGGLYDTIARLKIEVSFAEKSQKGTEDSHYRSKGKQVLGVMSDTDTQPMFSGALVSYHRKLLLKALLRAISLATYVPGSSARIGGSEESVLPHCLSIIFRRAKDFGGGVFSLAAIAMSDLIHKDPTCFPVLDAADLPKAFLDAILGAFLCSSEAVKCIPQCLDALCLNNSGLQQVRERNALRCFVKIFTSKSYLRALSGDTLQILSNGLDELMRHASTLRTSGVDMLIEILNTILKIGSGSGSCPSSELLGSSATVPMETDIKENNSVSFGDDISKMSCSEPLVEESSDVTYVSVETYLAECVSNASHLLETILQNADTCRIFIEKKGVEVILKLFTLPLPVSVSVGVVLSAAFKNVSSTHSAFLARAVCTSIREHLKITNELLSSIFGAKLAEIDCAKQNEVLKYLTSLEGLLSLSNFLLKGTTNMVSELGSSDADMFIDLGKAYKEILWQISLSNDHQKDEKRDTDQTVGTGDAVIPSLTGRDGNSDGHSVPEIRYTNPVSVRRSAASNWTVERDFVSVLRSAGSLHRHGRHGLSRIHSSRISRQADASFTDSEGAFSTLENLLNQEIKKKSPDVLISELLIKLGSAIRSFLATLVKGLTARRRNETNLLSSASRSVVTGIAKLFNDALNYSGHSTDGFEMSLSVKCRYLGKVVDDMSALTVDKRRVCHTVLVNSFYVNGTFKELLTTFEATSQLLWTLPLSIPPTGPGQEITHSLWLLDTLQSYCRMLEYLVNASLLLSATASSQAQLLVHPVASGLSIGLFTIPRDPEQFVRMLQSQVLDVILPVLNHPKFPTCSLTFITAVISIVAHIYSGVGDLKHDRSGATGSTGQRIIGPPLDESTIATIVEMGFPRARAEEALRSVRTSSVELATDWLFSHPEEVQEDDQLAQALALSLGTSSETSREDSTDETKTALEERVAEAPPIDDILNSSVKLFQSYDSVSFPLTDLLITLCNRNKGNDRPRVVSYLIQQLKLCPSDFSKDTAALCQIAHVLALLLSQDTSTREIAAENGLVSAALGILMSVRVRDESINEASVTKSVSALLLLLDNLLQSKPKFHTEDTEGSSKSLSDPVGVDTGLAITSPATVRPAVNDTEKESANVFDRILGSSTGYLTFQESQKALVIACELIKRHVPAAAMQAVLQVTARLTKTHAIATQFLESGGLTALFSLPRTCIFPGFDSFASSIIRHLLEDPQTLQSAMELEIRQTLLGTLSRHAGRLSPRLFLTSMAPLISRDPATFMLAAAAVCQIDSSGGRLNVVLLKEKEKEKEKVKGSTIERGVHSNDIRMPENKPNDAPGKCFRSQKRVPASLSQVIDQLLEILMSYPSREDSDTFTSSLTPLEIDEPATKEKGKSKIDEKHVDIDSFSEKSALMAKVTFVLKLMSDLLLMYVHAVGVVLRRDSEMSQLRGSGQVGGLENGGVLHHVLHHLLPLSSVKTARTSDEWGDKLSEKASWFLVVLCGRSAEGRRRVIYELVKALASSSNSENSSKSNLIPGKKVFCLVDLVNSILTKNSSSSNLPGPGCSPDAAKTMIDGGMVQSLSSILQVIDLDHPDAPKVANLILKALESLTRAANASEHASKLDGPSKGRLTQGRTVDQTNTGTETEHHDSNVNIQQGDNHGVQTVGHQVAEAPHNDQDYAANPTQSMEQNMRLDREDNNATNPSTEESVEFMHEEMDLGVLQNTNESELAFRVEHRTDNIGDDDDEDMVGDDDEDVDDDEEDVAAEGAALMSLVDTDVEDRDDNVMGDEFNEAMIDEDAFPDNHVIEVRLREGLAGLDRLRVLRSGNTRSFLDIAAESFHGVNADEILSLQRPLGVEGRRQNGNRASLDRSGHDGSAFPHPLLVRPSQSVDPVTSVVSAAGSSSREVQPLTFGSFDVSQLYTFDAAIPSDHDGTSIIGDRAGGGVPPSFFDFSLGLEIPHGVEIPHMSGRRGGGDSRWTDISQPQAAGQADAIAQALEAHFVRQLRGASSIDQLSAQQQSEPSAVQVNRQPPIANSQLPASVSNFSAEPIDSQLGENASSLLHQLVGVEESQFAPEIFPDGLHMAHSGSENMHVVEEHTPTTAFLDTDASADLQNVDHQMQDSSEIPSHSMELDDGRVDGPSDADNHSISSTHAVIDVGSIVANASGSFAGPAHVNNDLDIHDSSSRQNIDGPQGTSQTDQSITNNEDSNSNAIDPTFLEALPEDLRAEVLASQQAQPAQPATYAPPLAEEIDPEFLAALPPDIQAEVLAQQRAQRTIHSQQAAGQPVDMDNASIIATFPPELREEVLLTSSDAVLSALPSALLAEAQILRDRAASHYHARSGFFGGSHRLGTRRLAIDRQTIMDRGVGVAIGQRAGSAISSSLKVEEIDGMPLLDANALKALIRLLRLAQPLGKGLLQRLLLNLCVNPVTRAILVRLLVDMIRPEGDISCGLSVSASHRLYGCQWNVVYGRPQSSDGLPPLVSRRVLEILVYLATNHSPVANILFYFDQSLSWQFPTITGQESKSEKGKEKVIEAKVSFHGDEASQEGDIPLVLFLKLLNRPLFLRSSAHLEQVMGLLQIVVHNAVAKIESIDCPPLSGQAAGSSETQSTSEPPCDIQKDSSTSEQITAQDTERMPSTEVPSSDGKKCSPYDILLQLPEFNLRNLCSVLAHEGLSDKVYLLASDIVTKLASVALPLGKFFAIELAGLAHRLSDSAVSELVTLRSSDMLGLSSGSMAGAAILRVLGALSGLTLNGNKSEEAAGEHADQSVLWNLNVVLEPLWQELSDCITTTEIKLGHNSNFASPVPVSDLEVIVSGNSSLSPPLPPGTQRLLPFIEAFFVLCEKLQTSQPILFTDSNINAREIKECTGSSSSPSLKCVGTGNITFARIAEKHRRLLNVFIRQNPSLLEKSLSLMLKVPRLIDFDNKRAYFRSRIRQQHGQHPFAPLRISVRRAYVLEDSYNQLRLRPTQDLKGRLTVQFQGEEGIDAGGLTREWYQLLSRVIFDKGALLFTTVGNDATFQPNPNSVYQTEHLSYFRFVGRVVAKALFDGQLLDVYFTRSFYKHILGVKVTYHDIEAVDPDYYKNLKWMLENDVSDIPDLTFSMDADEEKHILYEKTEVTDYELIPGGRNVRVTEETKQEYVDLVAEHILTTAIRPQINSFLEGFNELVSRDLISIFNDKELELLISGLPEIDFDDLKAHTEYTGFTAASTIIHWFWDVVKAFNKEDMARFLQFVTGTSKVPLEGFKALQGISGPQRFQIHKAYGAPERLPSAHTCFNQLDLPEYSSKEQLEERLLLAIHEASEGFGFG